MAWPLFMAWSLLVVIHSKLSYVHSPSYVIANHSTCIYPVSPDSSNSQLCKTSKNYYHNPIIVLPSYYIKIEWYVFKVRFEATPSFNANSWWLLNYCICQPRGHSRCSSPMRNSLTLFTQVITNNQRLVHCRKWRKCSQLWISHPATGYQTPKVSIWEDKNCTPFIPK